MATILVVEDSLTMSKKLQYLLQKEGYTVHVASDGLIALNAMRTFKPDLVLLDIRLPHVDGFQFCLVIRRMPKYTNVPIIMVSGLSNEADIQHALDIGANDYIVKPFQEELLLDIVAHHMAQAKLHSTSSSR